MLNKNNFKMLNFCPIFIILGFLNHRFKAIYNANIFKDREIQDKKEKDEDKLF